MSDTDPELIAENERKQKRREGLREMTAESDYSHDLPADYERVLRDLVRAIKNAPGVPVPGSTAVILNDEFRAALREAAALIDGDET